MSIVVSSLTSGSDRARITFDMYVLNAFVAPCNCVTSLLSMRIHVPYHIRYHCPPQMRYIPNTKEVDDQLPDKQYLNGHTDFGLVTLLFAQVIQGLQLQTIDGSWKHVPYIPDSIVVNVSSIHLFAFFTLVNLYTLLH